MSRPFGSQILDAPAGFSHQPIAIGVEQWRPVHAQICNHIHIRVTGIKVPSLLQAITLGTWGLMRTKKFFISFPNNKAQIDFVGFIVTILFLLMS